MIKLKKNAAANFLGQFYSNLLAILFLPLYLKFLGAEAYGLVTFFAALQAWVILLDAGFTPAVQREFARESSHADSAGPLVLLRSVEWVFVVVALLLSALFLAGSHWVATTWLSPKSLSLRQVEVCITLMGFTLALRFFSGLYKGAILGLEEMVWLNLANSILSTLRLLGSYALVRWISQDVVQFFEFQLVLAIVETIVLRQRLYKRLSFEANSGGRFASKRLVEIAPFAVSVAYTSLLWALLTQTDKLVLSHTLSLTEFGYFGLVNVICNGLLMLSVPITQAALPRLTWLHSRGETANVLQLYRRVSRYTTALLVPASIGVALYGESFILAWTGDSAASAWAGPILTWMALSTGLLGISGLQYQLQFAYGKLRLHTINSTINALIQVPVLFYFAWFHGAHAVAYSWLALRLGAFVVFPLVVHRILAPSLHQKWIAQDILPIAFLASAILLSSRLAATVLSLQGALAIVFAAGSLLLSCACAMMLARRPLPALPPNSAPVQQVSPAGTKV